MGKPDGQYSHAKRHDGAGRYEFVPQLLASIARHEECQNWCTWDNVLIARDAVAGDEEAMRHLRWDEVWQLDENGELSAT